MKNYYDILGLPSYEDSQGAILSSYKNSTNKMRNTIYDKKDVESKLINLNEAFLVLSDVKLKREYDYYLSSNTENSELLDAISAKRKKAESFIQSKLANTPKKKKRSKWPAIICGLLLLSAIGTIMKTCIQASLESSSAPSQKLGSFVPNSDWRKYEIANSFSISVPLSLELRHDYDDYTKLLTNNHLEISNADAVFQQGNLSDLSPEAFNTYCRILVEHYDFSPGDVERHNQTFYITAEDEKSFKEIVDEQLGPYCYVDIPTFQWVDISGTKALEAKYKRTGDKGPVVCRLYLLQNYNEMVEMVVSYRESDASIWKSDLENVIRTFKWNTPK